MMNEVLIRPATKEDFEAIAQFILEENKSPQTHCIHSDLRQGLQATLQEMLRLEETSEICFAIALRNNQCMGAIGCELDEATGRGWLRGPFVSSAFQDWETIAIELLQKLSEILPSSIRRLDSFLNITNERGHRFYIAQGFRRAQCVHVYVTQPPEGFPALSPNCGELSVGQTQDFIALHDAIFPETYASGQRIVDEMADAGRVFVYAEEGTVLGYLYGTIEEEAEEGMVEFLGVREDARGRGIGFQLLQTALQWFFQAKGMPQVSLTVNDDLTNARSLYEKAGFQLQYTGVNTRKEQ